MAKVEGGDDLSEEPPRLLRGQPALLDEVVEQLAPRHVLQHQVLIQFSTVQYSSVHNTTYYIPGIFGSRKHRTGRARSGARLTS